VTLVSRSESSDRRARRLRRHDGLRLIESRLLVNEPFSATEHGIRLEQLKTLARLRDSGAMTEDEFEAQKHRILASECPLAS
jgi:Short C-terminal domain